MRLFFKDFFFFLFSSKKFPRVILAQIQTARRLVQATKFVLFSQKTMTPERRNDLENKSISQSEIRLD